MKRAIATDYHPLNLWVADARYAYGTTSSPAQTLERLSHGSRVFETAYDFGNGNQVIRIFTTDLAGEVFVVWKVTATNVHTLARSTDYGNTFANVLEFPAANIYLLSRGLTVGYPGGVRTYALCEYLSASGPQAVRVLTSTDGINWASQCSVTAGTSENIRHWHNVAWNPYNEHWYLCSGDTNAQSALIATQDLSLITDAAPSTWGAIAGLHVAQGAQRNRTVDFLFTPRHVFTSSDTLAGGPAERGIWRWQPDLSFGEHVDTGDGRYTDGGDSRSTMWIGVKAENHLLWCSYEQTAVAGKKHLEIYGAEVGKDGPGQWREIARVYTRNGTTSDVRGFWYNDGLFGFCFGRGAGKETQNETAIFRLDGEFTDDLLATSAVNGKPIYIPDTIHPVYWLGGDGASDSNDGYTPDAPLASITYALQGSAGAGNVTINSITESSGLATVTTASAHGYSVGQRVTLAGNTPSAYNRTFRIVTVPTTTTFTVRIDSGTGNASGTGTVNDTHSAITYGGKVICSAGEFLIPTSFNVQLDKFPYNQGTSGVHGLNGEAGHPITLSGQGIDRTIITDPLTTAGVSLAQMNTADDFLIIEGMHVYHKRDVAGARTFGPANANSRFWARDAQLGHDGYTAQGWRNGSSVTTENFVWRCRIAGDTAGSGRNQPGLETDGTAMLTAIACLIETTYRGARCRVDGARMRLIGCLVRSYSQAGFDTATNNDGRFEALGNVFVSSNGTATSVDSGTGTLTGGHRCAGNFTERTPPRTRDRTGVDMQALGTALTDYFVDGDPRQGLAPGSPLIEAASAYLGVTDYTGARRKNPSSIGHLEYRPGIRPAALTRPST